MAEYSSKIKDLEAEIKKTQYNKATQHHIGLVKAKIAQLKEKEDARSSKGGGGKGYSVRKSGDATVILLGFPSAGKSTLLNALTGTNSPVGAYEFTTLDVIPGTLLYKDAKIQILDMPGIVRGAAAGTGRGREVLSVLHNADLVLMLIDVFRPDVIDVLLKEVYDAHLRLNQRSPNVVLKKTPRGGINIGKTVRLTKIDDETIEKILKEFRINNCDIVIREDITAEQLIDVIQGNKVYTDAITVLNKIDMISKEDLERIKRKHKPDICISADQKVNLGELKDLIYSKLGFVRVYCKEIGKKADLNIPLILRKNATIETMCHTLHKDFVTKFKYAKIWGNSVKFSGQRLNKLAHLLKDKDIVEIHLK
ncbi:GTP-binding protein [Candidatus Woesearchaeota archaeon]|nr:GTP-binding protein [Candidatus Woesearchaeota archaeon]